MNTCKLGDIKYAYFYSGRAPDAARDEWKRYHHPASSPRTARSGYFGDNHAAVSGTQKINSIPSPGSSSLANPPVTNMTW